MRKKRPSRRRLNRRQFVVTAATQAAGASLAASAVAGDREAGPKRKPMRLHIVGSGCPAALPDRYGSCFILEVGKDRVMIDCGPGTTYKMARMGLNACSVEYLFFTHHHFDHNCDFPCFALSRWDSGCRGKPSLKVYGPPPTETFVQRLFGKEGAFIDDINSRIEHSVSQKLFTGRGGVLPRPAPPIETKNVKPGKIAESDYWRATATRVHHVEPTLESLAFRFDTEQGSIVFAADCGDCKSLRELTQGADTLVIGCVYIGHSKAYDGIITGTGEAAEIASACGVERLILSHAAPRLGTGERKKQAIADAARNFSGQVCFPDELTTVELTL